MLNFRPHEYALEMPAMSEQEYSELKADIAKNGLIDAIVLYEGEILEGVHRFKACKELGIEGRFVNWVDLPEAIKKIGLLTYVWSKNVPRRHLTTEVRVERALKLLPRLSEEAKARQFAGERASHEAKGKTAEKVGKLAGVSTSTVERVIRRQRDSESEPEEADEATALRDIEDHFRALVKDVRDMISKVLQHHTDWSYGQRAWLCSKAASKLAALARKLSRQDKEANDGNGATSK